MKLTQRCKPKHPPHRASKTSTVSTASYAAAFLPLPASFLQLGQFGLEWILIAIIIGIVLIFFLIAFILLPLSRRAKRQKKEDDQQAEIDTRPTPQVEAEPVTQEEADDEDVTQPSPALTEDEIDTVVSPVVAKPVAEPATTPISGKRPPDIGWQIAGLTDVGLKRELNEDNMIMIEGHLDELGPYGIYVVADGLGGHEAGEIASQLTVEAIQQKHAKNPPADPFEEWLKEAVMAANEAVLAHQESHAETSKMGSTLVMALIAGQNAHIVNVGDSRAYRLNSQAIDQISVDHSLVERLVQIGQITREEARTHKQRNVIYSIIGEKRRLEIGYYHVALDVGERLLLCSDGLSGMVNDEELQAISHQHNSPAKAVQTMVQTAKDAGGHDNITAILIQMNSN